MRPGLNILEPELIGRIVDEAKRVLAEHGFEIRGPEMRRRLIAAGLPQRDDGRILFPRAIVEEAIRARRRRSSCSIAAASRAPTSAGIASTSSRARAG